MKVYVCFPKGKDARLVELFDRNGIKVKLRGNETDEQQCAENQ